jgi:type II secretory pathway component PulC
VRRALDFVTPALALGVLAFVTLTTLAAVRRFDVWRGRARDVTLRLETDPYADVERILSDSPRLDVASMRNPFTLGSSTPVSPHTKPHIRPPAPPEPPLLTAIIWSDDPRAVIQWNGRSYSLRSGQAFEGFRVVRIQRDRVVLDEDGRPLALELHRKGE